MFKGEQEGAKHPPVVIEHEEGLFKGCPSKAERVVLLNKAEDDRTRQAAERIGSLLTESGAGEIERIVIGAVGNEPPLVICHSRTGGNPV